MTGYVQRFGVLIACLGWLDACAWCLKVNAPWLVAENQRLEPWKIPIVWLSEACGVAAIIGYMVRIAFTRADRPWHPRTFSVRVIIIGTCLDAGMSLWSMVEEYLGHSRAVRVQAQVINGKTQVMVAGDTRYTFTCTFQDQQGIARSAWFPQMVQQEVPITIQQAIQRDQFPVVTDVLYDPQWPGRTWLADLEYSDGGRLFFYSLMCVLCSFGLALVLRGLNTEGYRNIPPPASGAFFMMTAFLGIGACFQEW